MTKAKRRDDVQPLQVRVSGAQRTAFERAAAAAGLTLSGFIRQAAIEKVAAMRAAGIKL